MSEVVEVAGDIPRNTLDSLVAESRYRLTSMVRDRRDAMLEAEKHRRVREAPIDVPSEVASR